VARTAGASGASSTPRSSHRCVPQTSPGGPPRWYLRRELDGPIEPFAFPASFALNNIAAVHQAVVAGL
jgi:hypothetical protein